MEQERGKSGQLFHGFLIAGIALLTGLVLDAVFPPLSGLIPQFPINLIILVILVSLIVILAVVLRKSRTYAFMASVRAAVPALSLFVLLVILMGLIPQSFSGEASFLNSIRSSWTFYLSGLFLLIVLIFATGKYLKRFNLRNAGFVLNHLGIAVILLAAAVKQSDYHKYSMTLRMDQPVWYASDHQGNLHDLDFALEMKAFTLDYHPPLLEIKTPENKTLSLVEISSSDTGQIVKYKDLKLRILSYLPEASISGDAYVPYSGMNAVPAVEFRLSEDENASDSSIWVGAGNQFFPKRTYRQQQFIIELKNRMPRQYTTRARLYKKEGESRNVRIQVNKPAEINGWKVYQQSYDQRKGTYSDISVLSLVKDPWLPLMYFGIFMLMAGIVLMFVRGKPKSVL